MLCLCLVGLAEQEDASKTSEESDRSASISGCLAESQSRPRIKDRLRVDRPHLPTTSAALSGPRAIAKHNRSNARPMHGPHVFHRANELVGLSLAIADRLRRALLCSLPNPKSSTLGLAWLGLAWLGLLCFGLCAHSVAARLGPTLPEWDRMDRSVGRGLARLGSISIGRSQPESDLHGKAEARARQIGALHAHARTNQIHGTGPGLDSTIKGGCGGD